MCFHQRCNAALICFEHAIQLIISETGNDYRKSFIILHTQHICEGFFVFVCLFFEGGGASSVMILRKKSLKKFIFCIIHSQDSALQAASLSADLHQRSRLSDSFFFVLTQASAVFL